MNNARRTSPDCPELGFANSFAKNWGLFVVMRRSALIKFDHAFFQPVFERRQGPQIACRLLGLPPRGERAKILAANRPAQSSKDSVFQARIKIRSKFQASIARADACSGARARKRHPQPSRLLETQDRRAGDTASTAAGTSRVKSWPWGAAPYPGTAAQPPLRTAAPSALSTPG